MAIRVQTDHQPRFPPPCPSESKCMFNPTERGVSPPPCRSTNACYVGGKKTMLQASLSSRTMRWVLVGARALANRPPPCKRRSHHERPATARFFRPTAMRAPGSAASAPATTRPSHVSIVELDEPYRRWPDCDVNAHGDCTYEHPFVWTLPHVVSIYSLSSVVDTDADAPTPEQIWRQIHQLSDATVAAKARHAVMQRLTDHEFDSGVQAKASHVVALVISTRRGRFGRCQSLHSYAPAIARQLDAFSAKTDPSDRTLPSPKVGSGKCKIFVRDAYGQLAGVIKEYVASNRKAFVIAGTPGVGKAFFLWYLLRHLRSQSAVVDLDCADSFLLLLPDGPIIRGKRSSSSREYLAKGTTMYVCDAAPDREPLFGDGIAATTIVTKSLDQSMIKQFIKAAQPKVLFMPLWTIDELDECRVLCFESTAKETLSTLFASFGGTARETLVPDEDDPRSWLSLPLSSTP